MKKKLFALIMALCMISSIMPVPAVHSHAYAEDCDHTDELYIYYEGNHEGKHIKKCFCGAFLSDWESCVPHEVYTDQCSVCADCMGQHYVTMPATCTDAAWCGTGGHSFGEALGHDFQGTNECQREGCNFTCDHEWNNYEGKCAKCDATHIHTYCGYRGYPCEKCGYKEIGYHFDLYPHNGVCDVCGESMDESTGPADENGNMSNTSWMVPNFDDKNHWMEHKTTGEIDEDTVEPHDWANDKGECACGAHHIHDVCVVTASFSDKWNCSLCGMLRAAMVQDYWPADGHCDNGCGGHITSETQFNATHHWEWCEQCGKILGDWGADGSYIEEGTKVEHTWVNGKCSLADCGYVCKHEDSTEATCAAKAKCNVCGVEYGDKLRHEVVVVEISNLNLNLEYYNKNTDQIEPTIISARYITGCKNCDWTAVNTTSYMPLTLVEVTQEATCEQPELATFSGNRFAAAADGKWYNGLTGYIYNVQTAPADPDAHVWVDGVCTECEAECAHEDTVGVQVEGAYNETNKTHQHKLYCATCNFDLYPDYLANCGNWSGGNNCSTCGGAIYHNGGEATCTEKAVCDSCGLEYGKLLDHDWAYADGTCKVCTEHHIHDNCLTSWEEDSANNTCTKCGYWTVGQHPDFWPRDGHCDTCLECLSVDEFKAVVKNDATQHWVEHVCGEKYYIGEHDYENGVCTVNVEGYGVCGHVCEHPEYEDGKCVECGAACDHTTYEYEHIEGTEDTASKHVWLCTCGWVISAEWPCSDENGDFICDLCEYEFHTHDWSNKDGVCAGGCGTECEHANVEYISDKNGRHSLECLDCGLVYVEGKCYDYDNGLCDACGYELFHNWSNNDGICANCGEKCEHEAGHKAINKGDKKHMLVCPTCGHNFDGLLLDCYDSDGDRNCDACGVEVYHLHDWSNKDGVCVTCGEKCEHDDVDYVSDNEGNHTLMCLECGVEYITGKCYSYDDGLCDACEYEIYHYSKTPATCTEGAVCDHCGEAYADALDHDWSNKDGVCARGCGETCKHPNEKAVSNGKGQHMLVCDVCGNTYGDLLINCREGEVAGVCASCDYEMYHAGGTPTCAEQAICQNCGEPYGETLPHTWKFNEEASTLNVEKKSFNIVIDCSECGKVYPIATSYNAKTEVTQEGDCDTAELTKFYTSGNAWGVAFEIEEIVETKAATGEHNYEVVKSEPATCTLPAYYWYECSVCGAEKNGEDPTGALAEHDYEVVKSEPANCIYPAYYWYECSVCGAEMNREEGEATGIHVDLDKDYVCDVCDFVMGNPCDHEGKGTYTFTVEANCTNEGYVEVYCAYCEEVISKETLEVNDAHVFYNGVCLLCGGKEEDVTCDHEGKGTYTFTVEATCSAEGVVEVYCSGCAKLISSEILEKNDAHVFYNGVCLLCGEPDECKHNYELVKEEPATCEYPAYYWYKCTECGEELNYEDKTGALADHDYEVVKSEPATCVEPAYYWYECTVCGAEKNGEDKTGALADHDYEVVKSEPATCLEPAYYWYECTVCGAEKNGEDKTGALADHDYEVVKSEPATCLEPAYYWYECTVCGAEKNGEEGEINPNAHNYKVVKSEPASCIYPAYYWYECVDCGAEMNREEGEATGLHVDVDNDGICDVCDYVIFVACDHEGKGTYTFTIEANCTEKGLVQVFCAGCEELLSETEVPTNDAHVFINGVCLLCGETDECKHNYELVKEQAADCQYPAYYWFVCTECGEELNYEDKTGALGEHDYELVKEQAADCQYPAYYWYECTVCGAEKNFEDKTGALGEHDYELVKEQAADCQYPAYYWYECKVCGEELNYEDKTGALGEHDYELVKEQAADCQYPAYYWFECTVCGAEKNYEDKTGALGEHDWDEGKVTTEPTVEAEGVKTFTCTVCGETKTEAIEKLDHAHDYKAVVTAPTCTKAGYTTYTCECGDSYIADEVAVLRHTEVKAGKVAPTCTTAGKEADIVCSVCDTIIAEGAVIAALGHKEVSADNAVKATCTTAGKEADTVCSVCGEVVAEGAAIKALGHTVKVKYTFNADFTKRVVTTTCTVCGEILSVVEEDY